MTRRRHPTAYCPEGTHTQHSPPPRPNATITRVWQPADGLDTLTEILESVIVARGSITACIPAVALSVEDLINAGARAASPERVA